MRLPLTLTALALAASLTGCAGAPAPSASLNWSPPPVLELALSDDAAAWEIFEHGGGTRHLPLDTSRAHKVVFLGAATEYPAGFVALTDAAIPGKDGRWYWFRASYTD